MDIALVYAEAVDLARFKEQRKEFPPFGPMYLAAVLENAGHSVSVIKVTDTSFVKDFHGYDAVGFSLSSSATVDLMKRCRFESKYSIARTLLMAGGVHAQFFPERTLSELDVELVCYGEGEDVIIEAINCYAQKQAFDAINGIVFKSISGVKRTPPRDILKSIDHLPLPARHLFAKNDIIMSDRLSTTDLKLAHVMFSRGCPYLCAYCAVAQTKVQYRHGKSARHELESLIETYGIEGFAIVDDNFIINPKVVSEICGEISDLGLKWSALSRVDRVSHGLLADLRAAGCIELKFGVESGDEDLLKFMQKNTTIEQTRSAILECKKAGINTKVFVVHGFPGENAETTSKTIRLLSELEDAIDRVSVFRFVPLPGTDCYNRPEYYGIHGIHEANGWDGRWSKFHIHHNNYHWWGDEADFKEMNRAHESLSDFVENRWPDRYA